MLLVALVGCGRLDFDPIGPGSGSPASAASRLALGDAFTCATRSDGNTWCWGDNRFGQLATAPSGLVPVPTAAPAIPFDPIAIDAGGEFACAIAGDGAVWCWGNNAVGQLGDGDSAVATAPVRALLPRAAIAVSAASDHACALLDDATAWCWGGNASGRSGVDPGTALVTTPTLVLDRVAQIATGIDFGCALRTDRSVWCWGGNGYGDLGDGTGLGHAAPAPASGLVADAIFGGDVHACALVAGAYTCWGSNRSGEIGFPGAMSSAVAPQPLSTVTGFITLALGDHNTCGVRDDGSTWCWGDDHYGQSGLGDVYDNGVPVMVDVGGARAIAVAAGGQHTCALREDDTIACWGRDSSGELGDGRTAQLAPVQVPLPGSATAIATGTGFACALVAGAVYCWGNDDTGELGYATDPAAGFTSATPMQVPGLPSVDTIAAGLHHACALSGGLAYCWGDDGNGQLGPNGATGAPALVSGLPSPVTAIAAGYSDTCAIASSSAYCWGADYYGEIDGIAGSPSTPTPTAVPTVGVAIAVAVGDYQSCAVDANNAAWCWGLTQDGELGTGPPTANTAAPAIVAGSTKYSQLAAGSFNTCAVTTGGAVECWGNNDVGQLGDGTQMSRDTPTGTAVQLTASAIALRTENACAAVIGGVACWGANEYGQIGDGTVVARLVPRNIGMSGATAVAVGRGFACAIRGDGSVACWGDNVYGQLGHGPQTWSLVPIPVTFP